MTLGSLHRSCRLLLFTASRDCAYLSPWSAVDLDTTVLHLNLAVTAYVLTLAVFIPMSGWFADRFGATRIFIAALLIFDRSASHSHRKGSHPMDIRSTQEPKLAEPFVKNMAEKLLGARHEGNKIAVPSERLGLADAYAIQNALARRGGGTAAWKTSLPRPDFATLGIYAMAVCAPILREDVHSADGAGSIVVREPVDSPEETVGLELEVAYKLGRDFPASREVPEEAAVLAGIASAHIAVEICGARWREGSPPYLWTLADSLMNRSFVLGETIPDWQALDFEKLTARQFLDGKLLQESTGGHKGGNPLSLVVWQVQHCVAQRGGIPAGTVITTGQLSGNHWIKPKGKVRGEFPALGRAIEFQLTA